ncbi:hypothetical protein A2954_05120 [Candidatus Roizmanbacteria bacterium RIFCSPLOWO2_01_FULL_37_12]|uniref:Large ribosomal subunit protein bL25 n=1 Tax=Candidatus Roizmanbacteria bacterium RIFCSPLOWO2_01_FULL_37_12 TaxID=1802056 RepID=A0A1F7I8T1_9BACT|nr:MAG: hypothetical protein A2768_02215 [Candidatus Roizmanbacteria bacterium RIFCSPHIGHO2_01_FULL_37_16]OGK23038.1 MAG: hypothetical protein A3D76_06605 [Candidatus Roizmanbacteria bacterium RIFCSPHIGHO2_02_FULL_37_9b]OGK39776.1 MAG: hypothetical protein A2954_05120 [Candidatus Roizmanbacteria bacterium RIFCSPLOWO2_01_FULL_37_12]
MAKSKKSPSTDNKLTLNILPRTIFGKKLKKFRKDGYIPANIFGQEFKSQSVSVTYKDFVKVYKAAKETGVIYLKLEKNELPALTKNVQRHPVNDNILHVDFRKIDLKQKIQTDVPVKVVGQSDAVTQKGGVLLTQTESLLVEALPTDIPHQIEVDIASLKEIGKEIKVSDLAKSDKYEIKTIPDKVIVSVVEHKEEEILPQTAPTVAPEVITAKPEEAAAQEEKTAAEPVEKKAGVKPPEQAAKKAE